MSDFAHLTRTELAENLGVYGPDAWTSSLGVQLTHVRSLAGLVETMTQRLVREAAADGMSLSEIGTALDISKQAAHQRLHRPL